jgi:hypothetical protein
MKGIALRSLPLERRQFVAAASAVSLAGDATKVMIFSRALLFDERSGLIIAATIPLMVAGVLVGQRINSVIGERGYAALFWAVITGYSVRLLIL